VQPGRVRSGTTRPVKSIKPEHYVCRACDDTFPDWKKATAHLKD
jgi:hypothetical protein